MATSPKIQDRYLEIVFAGKNKNYGAFRLRSEYERNLSIAVMFGSLLVVLGSLVPILMRGKQSVIHSGKPIGIISLENINIPVLTLPKEQAVPKASVAPSVEFTPYKVVADNVNLTEYIPTVDDLRNSNPGKVTVEGDPNVLPEPGTTLVEEKKTVPVEVPIERTDEPVNFVEEMPSFPGGEREMVSYLVSSIKYPELARKAEIEGKVFLSFVIEKSGDISSVGIIKGIGGGCDEEAVRVISTMPRWRPGKQNGAPVRVRVVIPVQFRLR